MNPHFLSKIHELKTKLYYALKFDRVITTLFHRFYYSAPTWRTTTWLGTTALKCPLDLWIYQEMIYKIKPDVIIECGTSHGGSAYYLASMCDLVGHGKIVTVDIVAQPNRPVHPRITYVMGSSTAPETLSQVRTLVGDKQKILVILDSDHSKDHVLQELNLYHSFVPIDSYIIVEDTNINGHPVYKSFGPGPMEAVDVFLANHSNFAIDHEKEKFHLTFNPRGYLKRIS